MSQSKYYPENKCCFLFLFLILFPFYRTVFYEICLNMRENMSFSFKVRKPNSLEHLHNLHSVSILLIVCSVGDELSKYLLRASIKLY